MDPAERLSSKQKQISISEFFEKNKHFLGFDTLQRSIITAVKEAVDNSLDACEEARILPEINVEIKRMMGDRLRLITQDNGPGIPEKNNEDVFKPFFTLEPSRNKLKGESGLGMTIARDIIRSHGGDIKLGKSLMSGLKIIIELPI